jgi:hypothetical protein
LFAFVRSTNAFKHLWACSSAGIGFITHFANASHQSCTSVQMSVAAFETFLYSNLAFVTVSLSITLQLSRCWCNIVSMHHVAQCMSGADLSTIQVIAVTLVINFQSILYQCFSGKKSTTMELL